MASTADSRCVGVYSRRAEMRSIASGGALRKTLVGLASCLAQSQGPEKNKTDLIEGMRFDLRELVLHIIGVHGADLLPSRGAQNLDDFY